MDIPLSLALTIIIGLLLAYILLPKLRSDSSSSRFAEAVGRANDAALKLLEQAKKDAGAAPERARHEASELTRQAEDTRRRAEDAKREAEQIKKEAALEAKGA